jgi:uncharacterized protein
MTDSSAFFQAIQNGDESKVGYLLDADSSLASSRNERGQSAILVAIYSGRKAVRDLLLARGVTLDLHEAAAAGQLEQVKQIVEEDAALAKSFSPDGFPVVALASVFGHLPVAQYLFQNGADINAAATNGTGYNALTGAVTGGHAEIVAWLLANGANPNYRYGPGYSPLLAGAANGHVEIVKMLLQHSADLQARSNDGKGALRLAEEHGRQEMAEFLRARGAK